MKSLLTILSLVLASGIFAQSATDMEIADQEFLRGEYDKALDLYEHLSTQFSDQDEIYFQAVKGQIKCLLKLSRYDEANQILELVSTNQSSEKEQAAFLFLKGQSASAASKEEEAIQYIDQAIELSKEPDILAKYHVHKGFALVKGHNLERAKIQLDSANSFLARLNDDSQLEALVIELEARIQWRTGDFAAALRSYQNELRVKQSFLQPEHPEFGGLFASIGIMYRNTLQYDKALEFYGRAHDLLVKNFGEDHLEVANVLSNIGYALYNKKQFEEALEIHQKTLLIRKKKLDPWHQRVLQSLEHIGLCYGGLEKYDQAESYFKEVLSARIERSGYNNHWTGYALYNLGAVKVEIPDYEKAASYFSQAVEIGKEVYGVHNYDQADNYNRLANCYLQLGKRDKAIETFYLALQSNLPGYKWDGSVNTIPDISYYLSFREIQRSLLGLAEAHFNDNTDPNLSLSYIHTAELILSRFRTSFTKDSDLASISRSSKQLADYAIPIYYSLYEQTLNSEYLGEIFRYSELSKGSALMNKFSNEKAKLASGIPDDVLEKDKEFRFIQDSLNSGILKSLVEEEDSELLESSLFSVNRDYEKFMNEVYLKYPIYAESKFGIEPIEIPALQQFLSEGNENTLLIDFHLTEETLFGTVISKDSVFAYSRDIGNLIDLINDLRDQLLNQNQEKLLKSASSLYQLVFSDELHSEGKDLLIIPSESIGFIPFDLLVDTTVNNEFLVNRHVITYDLSATLLVGRKHKNQPNPSLLAYAPSFENETASSYSVVGLVMRSDELGALPGAQDEVEKVTNLFGGVMRLGDDASETNFKNEAQNFSVLHLATHSVVNELDPNYSKLVLTDTGDDEDGSLHSFELSNLQLNADLVTLSACNTGYGKIQEGEGVMSLARTFRSAGVPSVVMSLWPASDKSTPELMNYFYENLKNGQAKNVALTNAKRQYLEKATGKARHPFYWGGFVLIGDDQPIQSSASGGYLWFILIGAFAAVLLAWSFKKFSS